MTAVYMYVGDYDISSVMSTWTDKSQVYNQSQGCRTGHDCSHYVQVYSFQFLPRDSYA